MLGANYVRQKRRSLGNMVDLSSGPGTKSTEHCLVEGLLLERQCFGVELDNAVSFFPIGKKDSKHTLAIPEIDLDL